MCCGLEPARWRIRSRMSMCYFPFIIFRFSSVIGSPESNLTMANEKWKMKNEPDYVGGCMSEPSLRRRMANLLFFIPNMLVLCARLMVDGRVPAKERLLVAGAIVYAVVPLDFIPDMLPFVGQIDDAYLISMSLLRLMTVTDPRVVREHWRGGGDVIELVGSVAMIASKLLPPRIRRVLTAHIETEPVSTSASAQAARVQSITPSTDFDRA